MDSTLINTSTCQVCQEPCVNCCATCQKVSYCSKAHQTIDWKKHRQNCFPGIIEKSPSIGRYMIASRLIKENEIILKESPIISGPNGKTGFHPLCLACYRIVENPTEHLCTNCHWPIHDLCKNDPVHRNHECQIFAQNYMSPFNRREVHMYEKVLILRGLLQKKTNPENWTKILNLQSHRTERQKTHKGILLLNSAIEFIRRVCQLDNDFEDLEIDQVLGVLSTNAFATEDNLITSPLFRSGSYLFYNSSFPAHDCLPNSKWSISSNPSKLVLRALREIRKGESITQLYTESIVGTIERRQNLKETKYFLCNCQRCEDPTELGSYFSAIRCPTCPVGYLLPLNSLDENSIWKCTKPIGHENCTNIKTIQAIESFLAKIRNEHNTIPQMTYSLTVIQELENLLTKYMTQLHPNHYLIHEIEQDILQKISYLLASTLGNENVEGESKVVLLKKEKIGLAHRLIDLSRKSLSLLEKISPGLTTHRGRQMYFLQQGLGIVIYNQLSKFSKKSSLLPKEVLEEKIQEFLKFRKLGSAILETESEGREENILARNMLDNSTKIVTKLIAQLEK